MRVIAIVCYDDSLGYFFTNNFVNGKTHIILKQEDIRQIIISIKTRIGVAKDAEENVRYDLAGEEIPNSEYHEFQETINYLESLLKRLEVI